MSEFAWSPDTATIERAQLTGFLKATGHRSFDEMYRWSVNDIGAFTKSVLEFLDIPFQRPYHDVLDLSQGPEWAKWCVGGDLNISIACLDVHPPDRLAVIWEGEEGITRALTYAELRWQTDAFAARMASLGIARSDAVGIHLPMVPETVIALLACARLGAVAVPLFSGYGPVAIAARLMDVGAKLIVTADEFPRRGASIDSRSAVKEALSRCPCVQHVITIPRNGLPVESAADAIIPVTTGAEDLLLALYTSGTTGRPKGILHSHCGFPIKAAQDMCFGTDVGPGTRICWITDIGWMMGPWLIYGALIRGATMCLYDGAPDYPGPGRMWEFCERHSVEVLGISPTLVRSLAAHGSSHARSSDLRSLRLFASTGEPWNPDPWWWLFRDVGQERIPIINYSGGTEISGGILMSNPLLPIKPCAFAAPCPGIDADVLDENGQSVLGTVGELVIRKPWIGMARGFNNDADRYLSTYWNRWPGIWTHGDWAKRGQDGQWYILGRSDDTLKVAGKRIGPAEVESILVSHDAVLEAAVIGIPHEVKGECMIAFCVLLPDRTASPQLASELREIVGIQLGKPLRPDSVYFVTAIPKTRNAKVMRRVIRAAWLDLDSGDLTALDNPQSLDVIRSARE